MSSPSASLSRRRTLAIRAAALALPVVAFAFTKLAAGHTSSTAGISYGFGDDHGTRFGYALVEPGTSTISGTADEDGWERLSRLLRDEHDALLWFRVDGDEYVLRDRGLIERAREALREQRELDAKQGELGCRQEALGREQRRVSEAAGLAMKRIADDAIARGRAEALED